MKNRLLLAIALMIVVGVGTWYGARFFLSKSAQTDTIIDRQEQQYLVQNHHDYIEAINFKIVDLGNHIETLKLQRTQVKANLQADFDTRIAALEALLAQFKIDFAAFQNTTVDQFLTERAKLNASLDEIGKAFLFIIKDFKIKWPDGE